jgi:drug/metabolite transporter (DMT)-like permease
MTRDSVTRAVSALAIGLLLAASLLHFAYSGSVFAHVTDDFQPVVSAIWTGSGVSLCLTAALLVALARLQGVRRQVVYVLLALHPLTMGGLQLAYGSGLQLTADALMAAGVAILVTGRLGPVQGTDAPPAA